jgi:tRNA(adenine34) deaminase
MRMLNFYINRAGKNLSASRKAELERAKTKLSEIIASQKSKTKKSSVKVTKKAAQKPSKKTPSKSHSKKSSAK